MQNLLARLVTPLAVLALGVSASAAAAQSRIKDIAAVEGVRGNQLVGYGMVMGLNGTGDSLRNCPFTRQSLEGMTERLGAIRYGQEQGEVFLGRDMGHQRDYSEEVAAAIDEEVRTFIESAHQEAYDCLVANRDILDALVVDLQDIGTRSYTFISALKKALAACFQHGVEVIVLDRPNPLGGLKVDGPPMDADLMSYVGAYRVPYVHGLTMGELARMTKDAPEPTGRLSLTDAQRAKGKLTVIPMRGWTRSMRWTETGLTWIPTSPLIVDFEAVKGYPMTGLGCELGGFKHGVGSQYQFRGLLHLTTKIDVYEKELRALNLPGIAFRRVSAPNTKTGKAGTGLYIEIRDYDAWRPTELNVHLMRLACKLEPRNPFASAAAPQRSLFLNLMGSRAFFTDLVANGKNTDIERWLKQWRDQAKIYQQQSQKYWLYR
jgi:uncharacterized protein YbbC (DUF1343 family)